MPRDSDTLTAWAVVIVGFGVMVNLAVWRILRALFQGIQAIFLGIGALADSFLNFVGGLFKLLYLIVVGLLHVPQFLWEHGLSILPFAAVFALIVNIWSRVEITRARQRHPWADQERPLRDTIERLTSKCDGLRNKLGAERRRREVAAKIAAQERDREAQRSRCRQQALDARIKKAQREREQLRRQPRQAQQTHRQRQSALEGQVRQWHASYEQLKRTQERLNGELSTAHRQQASQREELKERNRKEQRQLERKLGREIGRLKRALRSQRQTTESTVGALREELGQRERLQQERMVEIMAIWDREQEVVKAGGCLIAADQVHGYLIAEAAERAWHQKRHRVGAPLRLLFEEQADELLRSPRVEEYYSDEVARALLVVNAFRSGRLPSLRVSSEQGPVSPRDPQRNAQVLLFVERRHEWEEAGRRLVRQRIAA